MAKRIKCILWSGDLIDRTVDSEHSLDSVVIDRPYLYKLKMIAEDNLTTKQFTVMDNLYFTYPQKSFRKVAKLLNVTVAAVYKLERRGIANLQRICKKQNLKAVDVIDQDEVTIYENGYQHSAYLGGRGQEDDGEY